MRNFKASKPKKKRFHLVRKEDEITALEQLRSFIEAEEPELVRFLMWVSEQQQHDISYKTLREACLSGELKISELKQWQEEYADYIQLTLAPIWTKAMENAVTTAQSISARAAVYQPTKFLFDSYLKTQCGNLITVISRGQHEAMQSMLGHLYSDLNWHSTEVSRYIRPLIGLNRPQMRANFNYYNSILQSALKEGTSEDTAKKLATERAAAKAVTQHRYRATMIARTELSFAFNQAQLQAVDEMVGIGLFREDELVKTVYTSTARNMCEDCAKMEGETVPMKSLFSNGRDAPPFHPNCYCTVRPSEKWVYDQFGPMGGTKKPTTTTQTTKPSGGTSATGSGTSSKPVTTSATQSITTNGGTSSQATSNTPSNTTTPSPSSTTPSTTATPPTPSTSTTQAVAPKTPTTPSQPTASNQTNSVLTQNGNSGTMNSITGNKKIPYTIDSNGIIDINLTPTVYSSNLLPNLANVRIPTQKLTAYSLNPNHNSGKHKAKVFQSALGYNLSNYTDLLEQVIENINQFSAQPQGDNGYGETYRVIFPVTGPNGQTANVLTGWVDHKQTGKLSMNTIYVQ